MLVEKYPAEIASILAKYPADQKRSAVMPLLYLAQSEYGYIAPAALVEVGDLIDLSPTEVASVVGFYTLFSDASFGKRRMQICTDLPCALRGAEAFAAAVCQKAGVKTGEITPDGEFLVETVMCLAGCDHAPTVPQAGHDSVVSPDAVGRGVAGRVSVGSEHDLFS